jgi:hypothetical protein
MHKALLIFGYISILSLTNLFSGVAVYAQHWFMRMPLQRYALFRIVPSDQLLLSQDSGMHPNAVDIKMSRDGYKKASTVLNCVSASLCFLTR